MNINEYMKANRTEDGRLSKRLECNDGFTMSVQGSEFNYCSPRKDGAEFYSEVEVGFPSEKPEFFAEYAESSCDSETDTTYYNYTDTVYGYVPVELVEQEIAFHGGIKGPTEWK